MCYLNSMNFRKKYFQVVITAFGDKILNAADKSLVNKMTGLNPLILTSSFSSQENFELCLVDQCSLICLNRILSRP